MTTGPTGAIQPTERTTVHRLPERARFDLATVASILDAAPVCHVGTVGAGGPVVLPMAFGRVGPRLYLHGSPAAGTLRELAAGTDACVTATVVDGLVLARSAFHHSMNYRCVVVFGRLEPVTATEEKRAALHAIVDHVTPGRWDDTRQPTDRELRATLVLGLAISEASAKVRTGGPVDDAEDLASGHWAGVLPSAWQGSGPAVPAEELGDGVAVPAYVSAWGASG